ncbi:hypothetical protein chiPu_0030360, partial [Chiloscyllium punctatum]|nr:hypothetical protein [Chiloscyllium punctatum]
MLNGVGGMDVVSEGAALDGAGGVDGVGRGGGVGRGCGRGAVGW